MRLIGCMDIENERLTAYVEGLLPQRDEVLRGLEAYAAEHGVPIVGPRVGTLLMILAAASEAKKALELGTAIGYSGTWIARGMASGGRLITVESRQEMARLARRNLEEAGVADSVEVVLGEASEVIPTLGNGFDFIFNDVDKERYPAILSLSKPALAKGGVLVTDNVLWSGRVASPEDETASTTAIREYNRLLAEDSEMATVILPIRDGVSISVKRV